MTREKEKTLSLGSLSIPIAQFASQGNAVLGIRDSGKTYSATYLAEQLLKAGIPFVAFDPSGVWKFLRVPGAGSGYPVVVAGGKNPDLPLTPASAPEIVRAAMRANVSLVVDLYDIRISKADWSRIVESCVRVLLYENGEHGLRHVFIEEAAEFAPQNIQGDKARVYAEVEKLARIGGNALLGYTLINQRAEQVNKAVLELCDCLFLHRQKGKNSLNSLAKWLEYSQGGETKDIIRSLPTLPSGDCWIWPANAERATRVKMPQKQSFHPDRRALVANPAAAAVDRVDAGKFVEQLKGTLDKYLKEAEANDPAALKRRIAELERKLAVGGGKTDADIIEARRTGERDGFDKGATHGYRCGWDEHAKAVHAALASIPGSPPTIGARPENPERRVETHRPAVASQGSRTGTALAVTRARQIDGRAPSSNGSGNLQPVQQRILNALAEAEQLSADAPDRSLVAILSGYTHIQSTGFVKALGALSTAGMIIYPPGGRVALTDEGRAVANVPDRPTTAEDLQERVINLIGGAASKVLRPLIEANREPMTRQDLASASGYGHVQSTGFVKTLGRLRTLGFIDYPASGMVVAKPVLFLEN